jgi:hypothetical protein
VVLVGVEHVAAADREAELDDRHVALTERDLVGVLVGVSEVPDR